MKGRRNRNGKSKNSRKIRSMRDCGSRKKKKERENIQLGGKNHKQQFIEKRRWELKKDD